MNEAEIFFTDLLQCDKASLYLNRQVRLNKQQSVEASSALKRRINSEPLQYILGKTEFMGLPFKVNRDVLIPRPETEILIETAMCYASGVLRHVSYVDILDIGTGSGCIAVSLAKSMDNIRITATDISEKALDVAKFNAGLNNVLDKIDFLQADLFVQSTKRMAQSDIIISNPPYIASQDIDKLQAEVQYEPRLALDGGEDGLDFYRRIIKYAPGYLKEGGLLILEMGFGQSEEIKKILGISQKFEIIDVVCDYQGIERVLVVKYG